MQSITAIGSIVGLLIINYISDHKGRKVAILTLQIVAIIGFASKSNFRKLLSLAQNINRWYCYLLDSFCVGSVVTLWCYPLIFFPRSSVKRSLGKELLL